MTPDAVLPQPVDDIPPPDQLTLEYAQATLERHARIAVYDGLQKTQPMDLRLRAAGLVLPKGTEITGADGGPIPIEWHSPIDPHVFRKTPPG